MRSPRPFRQRKTLGLGAAVAVLTSVLAACSTVVGPSRTTQQGTSPTAAAPATTGGPAASRSPVGTTPRDLLIVGRSGEAGLLLLDARTGRAVLQLPAGVPDERWARFVTASDDGSRTIVRDQVFESGVDQPRLDVDGRWRLPTIGSDRVPAGVSADGSTIALVRAEDASGGVAASGALTSRFAIVRHVAGDRPTTNRDAALRIAKVIELPGNFEFDALSPDGAILYVVEHLNGQTGAYQVRAVDVATGLLRDAVIADKRNIGEAMAGWPIAQLRRTDGVVLTLYRGAHHPFIHALNTIDAWAVCIDLSGAHASDAAAARDWGLVPSADGRSVYAINGSLGLAAEIDSADLSVRREGTLETASTGSPGSIDSTGWIVLAKTDHATIGQAGRVVVSPNGKTVWAAGANGVVAIETADLTISQRLLAGTAVDGIAFASDGSAIFALIRDGGRIVALDAASGRPLGEVPGQGFDRLLATAPAE